jgi:hypothetical protein
VQFGKRRRARVCPCVGRHWPTALVVRGGIFGNRVEVVRTAWIEGIKPREMAISVRERLAA